MRWFGGRSREGGSEATGENPVPDQETDQPNHAENPAPEPHDHPPQPQFTEDVTGKLSDLSEESLLRLRELTQQMKDAAREGNIDDVMDRLNEVIGNVGNAVTGDGDEMMRQKINEQLNKRDKELTRELISRVMTRMKKGEVLREQDFALLADDLIDSNYESALANLSISPYGFKNVRQMLDRLGASHETKEVVLPDEEKHWLAKNVAKIDTLPPFWRRQVKSAMRSGVISAGLLAVLGFGFGLVAPVGIATAAAGWAGANIARGIADKMYRDRVIGDAEDEGALAYKIVEDRLRNIQQMRVVAEKFKEATDPAQKARLVEELIGHMKTTESETLKSYKSLSRKAKWIEAGASIVGGVVGGAIEHAWAGAAHIKQQIAEQVKERTAQWAEQGVRIQDGHIASDSSVGHLVKETIDHKWRFVIENKDITHAMDHGANWQQSFHGAGYEGFGQGHEFVQQAGEWGAGGTEVPLQLPNEQLFHISEYSSDIIHRLAVDQVTQHGGRAMELATAAMLGATTFGTAGEALIFRGGKDDSLYDRSASSNNLRALGSLGTLTSARAFGESAHGGGEGVGDAGDLAAENDNPDLNLDGSPEQNPLGGADNNVNPQPGPAPTPTPNPEPGDGRGDNLGTNEDEASKEKEARPGRAELRLGALEPDKKAIIAITAVPRDKDGKADIYGIFNLPDGRILSLANTNDPKKQELREVVARYLALSPNAELPIEVLKVTHRDLEPDVIKFDLLPTSRMDDIRNEIVHEAELAENKELNFDVRSELHTGDEFSVIMRPAQVESIVKGARAIMFNGRPGVIGLDPESFEEFMTAAAQLKDAKYAPTEVSFRVVQSEGEAGPVTVQIIPSNKKGSVQEKAPDDFSEGLGERTESNEEKANYTAEIVRGQPIDITFDKTPGLIQVRNRVQNRENTRYDNFDLIPFTINGKPVELQHREYVARKKDFDTLERETTQAILRAFRGYANPTIRFIFNNGENASKYTCRLDTEQPGLEPEDQASLAEEISNIKARRENGAKNAETMREAQQFFEANKDKTEVVAVSVTGEGTKENPYKHTVNWNGAPCEVQIRGFAGTYAEHEIDNHKRYARRTTEYIRASGNGRVDLPLKLVKLGTNKKTGEPLLLVDIDGEPVYAKLESGEPFHLFESKLPFNDGDELVLRFSDGAPIQVNDLGELFIPPIQVDNAKLVLARPSAQQGALETYAQSKNPQLVGIRIEGQQRTDDNTLVVRYNLLKPGRAQFIRNKYVSYRKNQDTTKTRRDFLTPNQQMLFEDQKPADEISTDEIVALVDGDQEHEEVVEVGERRIPAREPGSRRVFTKSGL